MWIKLAADQGNALAKKNLKDLAAAMKPDKIARAEAMVKAWKPTK